MAVKTQKYVYIRSEVSYNYKWSVEYNIIKVKESIYRSDNSVRMLLSKMAVNVAAKTQKYVYIRSEVSYNYKRSVAYNIIKVKESIYRSAKCYYPRWRSLWQPKHKNMYISGQR